jgi:hypothetical protein
MSLDPLIRPPITGIRPFNELPVDAEIWREAHEHHHRHRRLHAAVGHRAGIVYGLEVIASPSNPRAVIVAPGVGIDDDGQTIVVSEPTTLLLEERGLIRVVLSFLTVEDPQSAFSLGGGQQTYRLIEGRSVRPSKEVPSGPHLELATIYRSSADAPIRDTANAFDPAPDELNLLTRSRAFPYCFVDAKVGELPYIPRTNPSGWKPNRAGLVNMIHEANVAGFHLDFVGSVNLKAAAQGAGIDAALLYLAGENGFQPLSDAEREGLRRFLSEGGVLMAEAVTPDAAFAGEFVALAQQLGANLQPVAAGHPLLTAHHIFPVPPAGAVVDGGGVFADMGVGIVLSTFNYGGAWQGTIANASAIEGRERVRQSQEFGRNIVAFAARRRRRYALTQRL